MKPVDDREFNPSKSSFWHDMNKHAGESYHKPPGLDYIVEYGPFGRPGREGGHISVWRAVSDSPRNAENRYEWEKVAGAFFDSDGAYREALSAIRGGARSLREWIDENASKSVVWKDS